MSIHRHAAKRDANEFAIRCRFTHHGWHTEQVSGAGMPDLLAFERMANYSGIGFRTLLVDVKMPDGRVTKPQERKWKALAEKGIPVYVVRTAADVDALVRGDLLPWRPWDNEVRSMEREAKREQKRAPRPAYTKPAVGESGPVYIPPRSKPVDAGREADETFAPPATPTCDRCRERPPAMGGAWCMPCRFGRGDT